MKIAKNMLIEWIPEDAAAEDAARETVGTARGGRPLAVGGGELVPPTRLHPALYPWLNAVPWLRTHRLAWLGKAPAKVQ